MPHNPFRKRYQYCTSIWTRTRKHQSFFHLTQVYCVVTQFGYAPYGSYTYLFCPIAPGIDRMKISGTKITSSRLANPAMLSIYTLRMWYWFRELVP